MPPVDVLTMTSLAAPRPRPESELVTTNRSDSGRGRGWLPRVVRGVVFAVVTSLVVVVTAAPVGSAETDGGETPVATETTDPVDPVPGEGPSLGEEVIGGAAAQDATPVIPYLAVRRVRQPAVDDPCATTAVVDLELVVLATGEIVPFEAAASPEGECSRGVTSVAMSPDGSSMIVEVDHEPGVRVYDLASLAEIAAITTCADGTWSPDSSLIGCVSPEGEIDVIVAATVETVNTIVLPDGNPVGAFTFSGPTELLVTSGGAGAPCSIPADAVPARTALWRVEIARPTIERLHDLDCGRGIDALDVAPDGRLLLIDDGDVLVAAPDGSGSAQLVLGAESTADVTTLHAGWAASGTELSVLVATAPETPHESRVVSVESFDLLTGERRTVMTLDGDVVGVSTGVEPEAQTDTPISVPSPGDPPSISPDANPDESIDPEAAIDAEPVEPTPGDGEPVEPTPGDGDVIVTDPTTSYEEPVPADGVLGSIAGAGSGGEALPDSAPEPTIPAGESDLSVPTGDSGAGERSGPGLVVGEPATDGSSEPDSEVDASTDGNDPGLFGSIDDELGVVGGDTPVTIAAKTPPKGTATLSTPVVTTTLGSDPDDQVAPTITFVGLQAEYESNEKVNITCTATDDDSGIASETCQGASGPVFKFRGSTTLTATATDVAGNKTSIVAVLDVDMAKQDIDVVFDDLLADAPTLAADLQPHVDVLISGTCETAFRDYVAIARAALDAGALTAAELSDVYALAIGICRD